jgi:hypothetical protein
MLRSTVTLLIAAFLFAGETRAESGDLRSLKYSNGRTFRTAVHEPTLIVELNVPDGEPYLVYSGLGCLDCDINRNLYIQSPADGPHESGETGRRYSYPGKYRNYESQSLVETVRTFIGRCTPNGHEGVIWFFNTKLETGAWQRSIYLAQVEYTKLVEYKEPRPEVTLSAATQAVSKGICKELPGKKFTTEP